MTDNFDKYYDMLIKSRKTKPSKPSKSSESSEPFGGFPPLFVCPAKHNTITETKERQYTTNKSLVSIKDIMSRRRNVVPYIITE